MRRNTSDLAQSGGRNGYSKSGWLEDLGETHIVCVPRLCIREAGDFVLFLNTLLATPVTRSFSVLFFSGAYFLIGGMPASIATRTCRAAPRHA